MSTLGQVSGRLEQADPQVKDNFVSGYSGASFDGFSGPQKHPLGPDTIWRGEKSNLEMRK